MRRCFGHRNPTRIMASDNVAGVLGTFDLTEFVHLGLELVQSFHMHLPYVIPWIGCVSFIAFMTNLVVI